MKLLECCNFGESNNCNRVCLILGDYSLFSILDDLPEHFDGSMFWSKRTPTADPFKSPFYSLIFRYHQESLQMEHKSLHFVNGIEIFECHSFIRGKWKIKVNCINSEEMLMLFDPPKEQPPLMLRRVQFKGGLYFTQR